MTLAVVSQILQFCVLVTLVPAAGVQVYKFFQERGSAARQAEMVQPERESLSVQTAEVVIKSLRAGYDRVNAESAELRDELEAERQGRQDDRRECETERRARAEEIAALRDRCALLARQVIAMTKEIEEVYKRNNGEAEKGNRA